MNNLHRKLAPISDAAWEQIEQEVARTFKRSVAGRRVVDVIGPCGAELAGVGTGHQTTIAAPDAYVGAKLRDFRPIVQFTVPFELDREQIDSVARGSRDADWQPAKVAATQLALAEDRAIFDGYKAAGIVGIREGSSNKKLTLTSDVHAYPDLICDALEELRLAGINGPYSVLLGADAYTALSEANDNGYPVIGHIKRIINGEIIWAPGIVGGSVLTTRGGDFELHLGEDVSIGYESHNDKVVRLYLRETFTSLLLTTEASVAVLGAKSRSAK